MNEKFVVNNWPDKNKHGAQSWTKLYRAMIDDCRFVKCSMEARAFAPMFLLLASENNGTVYHDTDVIALKLRVPDEEVEFAIDELLKAGYISKQERTDAEANTTINTYHYSNDIETERPSGSHGWSSKTSCGGGGQSTEDEINAIIALLCVADGEFAAAWSGWLDHRIKMRKPTNTRAKLLHLRLLSERPADSVRLLNTAMINGWIGLNWSWMDKPFMVPCLAQSPAHKAKRENSEQESAKRRQAW